MKYNYIKHLNTWFVVFKQQKEARPVHASMYLALFQMWNINRFNSSFVLSRSNLMIVAKIKSNKTYSKALKEMVEWKWIDYTAGSTFFGLSSFSLKPWAELQKMIKPDGDHLFLGSAEGSVEEGTIATPCDATTATPTANLGATSNGKRTATPYYKSSIDKSKINKSNYNTKDYSNYDEPL
ncbi:MAG: hypothetical protein LBI72_00800 [Flavobacteriaceae bacterium]|jgi:hypothetical protein|nr:hypothetical protein [Flavobacteriaceae bacterium]